MMVEQLVLAHGSGIDDVAWFVVPVLLALWLLRVAERRARRRAQEEEDVVDRGSKSGEGDAGRT